MQGFLCRGALGVVRTGVEDVAFCAWAQAITPKTNIVTRAKPKILAMIPFISETI